MDAAETLFADFGVAGTSLRQITTAAKANLASVSYHFGSKDGLLREVLGRRINPVNKVRMELLDALEAGD
ncbi:MAG: AcrR family transcriptional regulator, partial [Planctomycetota bacterium]